MKEYMKKTLHFFKQLICAAGYARRMRGGKNFLIIPFGRACHVFFRTEYFLRMFFRYVVFFSIQNSMEIISFHQLFINKQLLYIVKCNVKTLKMSIKLH